MQTFRQNFMRVKRIIQMFHFGLVELDQYWFIGTGFYQ